jgi:hypothetical protein
MRLLLDTHAGCHAHGFAWAWCEKFPLTAIVLSCT